MLVKVKKGELDPLSFKSGSLLSGTDVTEVIRSPNGTINAVWAKQPDFQSLPSWAAYESDRRRTYGSAVFDSHVGLLRDLPTLWKSDLFKDSYAVGDQGFFPECDDSALISAYADLVVDELTTSSDHNIGSAAAKAAKRLIQMIGGIAPTVNPSSSTYAQSMNSSGFTTYGANGCHPALLPPTCDHIANFSFYGGSNIFTKPKDFNAGVELYIRRTVVAGVPPSIIQLRSGIEKRKSVKKIVDDSGVEKVSIVTSYNRVDGVTSTTKSYADALGGSENKKMRVKVDAPFDMYQSSSAMFFDESALKELVSACGIGWDKYTSMFSGNFDGYKKIPYPLSETPITRWSTAVGVTSVFSKVPNRVEFSVTRGQDRLSIQTARAQIPLKEWAKGVDSSISDSEVVKFAKKCVSSDLKVDYYWSKSGYSTKASLGMIALASVKGADMGAIRSAPLDGGDRFSNLGQLESINHAEAKKYPIIGDYVRSTAQETPDVSSKNDFIDVKIERATSGIAEVKDLAGLVVTVNYCRLGGDSSVSLDVFKQAFKGRSLPIDLQAVSNLCSLSLAHQAVRAKLGSKFHIFERSGPANRVAPSAESNSSLLDWWSGAIPWDAESYSIKVASLNSDHELKLMQTAMGAASLGRIARSIAFGAGLGSSEPGQKSQTLQKNVVRR